MIERRLLQALAVLLTVHATPAQLCGQVVSGQVIDSISALPVGTGFVVLIDSTGSEAARALSTSDGRFRLRAPNIGTFRLRSERIGYGAQISSVIDLEFDSNIEFMLEVTALPVVLEAVEVPGEDRCHINPLQADATALVWEEVRKALAATAWDSTQELALYRKYSYERSLTPDRQQVLAEDGRTFESVAGQPYQSLPAALLARDGYIVTRDDGTIWYNLPDAKVLLDEVFLSTHCFQVVRDETTNPGQLGLAFEPVVDRGTADVSGALWLDETTSRLIALEVAYTNLPEGVRDPRAGGTVEFMQLPSGAWIVKRWNVRAPNIYRRQSTGDQITIVVLARRGTVTPLATERRRQRGGIPERSVPWGVTRFEAVYPGGRRIQLDRQHTVRRGDSLAVTIPWEAGGIAFRTEYGVSESVYLHPGEVYVVKYPEYFRPGGLLHKP